MQENSYHNIRLGHALAATSFHNLVWLWRPRQTLIRLQDFSHFTLAFTRAFHSSNDIATIEDTRRSTRCKFLRPPVITAAAYLIIHTNVLHTHRFHPNYSIFTKSLAAYGYSNRDLYGHSASDNRRQFFSCMFWTANGKFP